ncbi:MAG: hypothetical protein U0R52_00880 [Solirubrobacterales bacterium]
MPVAYAIAEQDTYSAEDGPDVVLSPAGGLPSDGDAGLREGMTSEEAKASANSPNPPAVPPDTSIYIAPQSADAALVTECRDKLSADEADQLCELYLLHAEGLARAGPYSDSQVAATLDAASADPRAAAVLESTNPGS